ncbi:MAG: sulfatase [Bacteroidota bacterium]
MQVKYCFFLLFICTFFLAKAQDRPNIVWIVTEDNSKHYLKLYDKDGASMPNIERLAQNGIVFNNCISQAPVCSVARSTIIAGTYAPRVGAQYHRSMEKVPMPENLKMFPYYLRQAGYYTTNNNKEDYNFIKKVGTWDQSSKKATYRDRKEGQPFFHVQNFGITHEGQLHFSEEKMKQYKTKNDPDSVTPHPYLPNTPTVRYTHAFYKDRHEKADQAIGQFLKQLEEDGLMEDTFIFYYGDHGGVLPGSKGYVYERGTHVPLVVYVPEKWKQLVPIKKGTRSNAFVQFIDFAPTVLHLAGVAIPDEMDGKAFLGEGITKSTLDARNTAYYYADRFDEKYDLVRAVRVGKYKYIRNYQPFNFDGLYNFYRYRMLAYKEWLKMYRDGALNEKQRQFFEARLPEALYDVEKDPFETNNLVARGKKKSLLKKLRNKLQQKIKSWPDLSFYPESYLLEKAWDNPLSFGQKNKAEINRLIDVADLSLLPFKEAKEGIAQALNSSNRWERYWGLIVCSTFGKQAAIFYDQARELSITDNENLVRMRAAEFLALTEADDPVMVLTNCLKNAQSHAEANLILNTVVLLKDTHPNYQFDLNQNMVKLDWLKGKNSVLLERLNYLGVNVKLD